MSPGEPTIFTSLGMLILDRVHFPSGKTFDDVLGGSGAYASLGARLFSPGESSTQIGYTVRQGYDFPPGTSRLLETWGITLSVIREDDCLSTRGGLHYLDPSLSTKSFKYLTPSLSINPTLLVRTNLLGSRCFHFFLAPLEIIEEIAQIIELRKAAGITERPFIVWEPRAYSCTPGNLRDIVEALRVVDVFSPNHHELARIMALDVPATPDKEFFERLCTPLMSEILEPNHSRMLVLRAGDLGCFVKTRRQSVWLPAYYSPLKNDTGIIDSKVVDTTGAGNAFLGAFAIGFMESSGDIISAACAGNIGASFVVEQVGVPELTISENGKELWNGEEVSNRLEAYKTRLGIAF